MKTSGENMLKGITVPELNAYLYLHIPKITSEKPSSDICS